VLVPGKRFALEVGEDADALANAVASQIMEVIATDADGDAWRGEVELLGDAYDGGGRRAGQPKVLATIPIKLDSGAPAPKPKREDEITSVITSLSKTIDGLGAVLVKVGQSKADEVQAYANMVKAVADSVTERTSADRKWDYKIERERQETDRMREEQLGKASRSRAMWEAFDSIGTEYKDIFEIWSKYYTRGRSPGDPANPPPSRPTAAEVAQVFDAPNLTIDGTPFSEVFDPMRAIISEMIAEADPKRRAQLARGPLRDALASLTPNAQQALKLRMLGVLGEKRCEEVAAWLTLPVS
jgi:hypothetical protein